MWYLPMLAKVRPVPVSIDHAVSHTCTACVSDGNPIKYLAGFERINLGPGQSETVTFNLSAVTFAVADADGQQHR